VPYISRKTIDEIQERLDAVSIIGEYVRLERRGETYWGLCPFHNEKTPSFSVNQERKSYYCFGCQEGGGVVNFLMAIEKISFPEALTQLAKKTGVEIYYENSGESSLSKTEDNLSRKKDDLVELYRRVAGSFHYILMEKEEGRGAKNYILERAINPGTIDNFNIGYAPADRLWLYKFLIAKGYSQEFLSESALFSKKYPQYAFFSNRLIFPINDRQGRTVAFGGRILSGDGPKYINSPESLVYKKRDTLFALDKALTVIRKTREVFVCEGFMDVIALHQAGISNSVAPLGTAFTDEQARLLRRWAEKVNLVFDSDEAGQNAAVKGIITCRKNALSCSLIIPQAPENEIPQDGEEKELKKFKDPADILKNSGEELLFNSLKNTIIDVDYLITKSKKDFLNRHDDSQGMSKAIAFLSPFYYSIDSEVDKEIFYKKVADNFGVEPQSVLHELQFGRNRESAPNSTIVPKNISRTVTMNEELFLLTALVVNCEHYPALFEKLRASLPKEEFYNQDAKNIYLALEECFRRGPLSLDAVLSCIEDSVLRIFLTQKSAVAEFSEDPERLVNGGIKGVKIKRLESRRQKIITEMKLARNEEKNLDDLLSEKMIIDSELQTLKGAHS
jgi:DNA primase